MGQLTTGNGFLLKAEDGFTQHAAERMTDAGDGITFTTTGRRFSLCPRDENGIDRRPLIMPDGVLNGCHVAASPGAADTVVVSAGTVCLAGVTRTINALSIAVPRPAQATSRTVSVAIDPAAAVTVVAGADGASHTDTRGTPGGPPWIPAGSIELATLRLSSASAVLNDADITFSPEYAHAPEYRLLPYRAAISFVTPLAAIHTGGATREVWAAWKEPVMVSLDAVAFRAPIPQYEMDAATQAPIARRLRPGLLRLPLGSGASLARRLAIGPRLLSFQPDRSQPYTELVYTHAELTADNRPRDIVTGEAALFAVEFPVTE